MLASDAHKVALRGDLARLAGKVAILSGGGSGHEPSHVGWVGEGMLAGAVCGEVFASPSAASAAAAGRAVAAAGASGVLFVIKNYTGDRLNFGFAVEALKSEGVAAEMVVVGEDCAIRAEQVGVAGRRGLAGTALVHKVAGAAAARGAPLTEVAEAARRAAGCIATMGVALSPCALPGAARPERLAEGEIEVGLGIHGEPGCYKRKAGTAREVVAELLEHISSTFMPLESGGRYARDGVRAYGLAVGGGHCIWTRAAGGTRFWSTRWAPRRRASLASWRTRHLSGCDAVSALQSGSSRAASCRHSTWLA